MRTLQIGQTTIPYRVRYSDRARRKRIVVTPERVEVVAPAGTPLDGPKGIEEFIQAKRAWVFRAMEEAAQKNGAEPAQRYASGAKLLYRGRRLMLKIRPMKVNEVTIECHSRFHVRVPRRLNELDRERHVALAFDIWLRDRALSDASRFVRRYANKLTVQPKGVRIGRQKRMWGTCGKDRIIRIHWRMIQAPAAAMEYVVAHEVCHLKHRHHDPAFWRTLGGIMPDWRERKALLEAWERETSTSRMSVM